MDGGGDLRHRSLGADSLAVTQLVDSLRTLLSDPRPDAPAHAIRCLRRSRVSAPITNPLTIRELLLHCGVGSVDRRQLKQTAGANWLGTHGSAILRVRAANRHIRHEILLLRVRFALNDRSDAGRCLPSQRGDRESDTSLSSSKLSS